MKCDGGFITPACGPDEKARLGGVLEVTRSFGDFEVAGISACPAVSTIQLCEDDDFVIVASDGLWDAVTPDEAVCLLFHVVQHDHAGSPL